jgi:hypothetical protein
LTSGEAKISVKPVIARKLPSVLLAAAGVLLLAGGTPDATRFALPRPAPKFDPPPGAMFADDFSHDLSRWQSDQPEAWSLYRGMLRADLPDEKQQRSFLYAGSEDWTDYAVDLDVCGMRGVDKGVVLRVQGTSGLAVDLRGPGYQDVVLQRREWPMGRAAAINPNGVWHHLRIEVQGSRTRVFVNGEMCIDRVDPRNARPQGRIALAAYTGGVAQCTVYFDNVVVTALP